ncbi:hypothetical protein N9V58_00875 [Candidatus Poseidoniales archaeon]|nr:hypothetical protein [Candidatus Poseidoniales archaeon]
MNERFRWRTNPAVVAQYFVGDKLPKNIDVHLKPNEACAVIENGTIVAVASATRMTLNPELGTLAKLLSRREPFRSFLFAHTGPHELLIPIQGTWSDGSKAQGMAGLKMRFNNEDLGRLLLYPSKGKNSITLGDVSDSIAIEISNKFAPSLSSTSHEKARNDTATGTLLESKLRSISQSALADVGGILDRVWISWIPSDHERIVSMRQELEMMAEEGRMITEKNRLEMERLLAQEVSVLERQHQIHLATAEYTAKAGVAKDLAALRVKAEKEREQWAVITNRDQLQAENLRRKTELEARQDDLSADLGHKNKMKGLDRTMDFEDKEAELERRRRQRKMETAGEQSDFLRKQEMKAAKHQQKIMKGMFDAMEDEEDDSGE